MTSDSKNNLEESKKLESIVYSLLSGEMSIDDLKSNLTDCDKCPDSLEAIIKDCLKNRVEKICCPEKIIKELRTKIGSAAI